MKRLLLFAVTIVALYGCYDSALDATDQNSDASLDYKDSASNPSDFPNDPYKIIGITPSEDHWKVIVQYSGGCNDHFFYTWWSNDVSANQTEFYLFHDGNGDSCEALVRDTVELDMSSVIEVSMEDLTVVAINASNNRSIILKPQMRTLAQGASCLHNTSFLGTACGQGIWDNQWFSLKQNDQDSSEKVWFQPVRNSLSVDLQRPTQGNYNVGVTFLFGYQYIDQDGACQSIPQGEIIPVAVNCLEKN